MSDSLGEIRGQMEQIRDQLQKVGVRDLHELVALGDLCAATGSSLRTVHPGLADATAVAMAQYLEAVGAVAHSLVLSELAEPAVALDNARRAIDWLVEHFCNPAGAGALPADVLSRLQIDGGRELPMVVGHESASTAAAATTVTTTAAAPASDSFSAVPPECSGESLGEFLNDIAIRIAMTSADDAAAFAEIGRSFQARSAGGLWPTAAGQAVTLTDSLLSQLSSGAADAASWAQLIGQLSAAIEAIQEALDSAATAQPAAPPSSPASPSTATAQTAAQSGVSSSNQSPAGASEAAPASAAAVAAGANDEADENLANLLAGDPQLVSEFVSESLDHIENAEASLLRLETNPEDNETLNAIFRAFHTIKGTAGFLGMTRIQQLAHRAETMLDRARTGKIRLTGGFADLALDSTDMLRSLIQGVRDRLGGEEPKLPAGLEELLEVLADPEAAGVSSERAAETNVPRLGDILVAEGKATREEIEVAATDQGRTPIGEAILKSGAAKAKDVADAIRTQSRMSGAEAGESMAVKVRLERLDSLINMVGELVIAHSMVAQDKVIAAAGATGLVRNVNHMGKIARELQDLSMSLRMVPLKSTFQKMVRLVRDLSHKGGKSVQLVTEGEETEIDRNMVEVINDPLVHMIRNAVDHGVEGPEERRQAGKEPLGTVTLRAWHSSGNIIIEMVDDGRGLDRQKIVRKAVERHLIESDAGLSDTEVYDLIFKPGFSTAEKVTEVSGRGVGMDVVKRGVEALRGRIELTSTLGRGTTFTMRLPLTLAIIDGMVIRVGEQRFIVPTANIHTTFRPRQEALSAVTGRGEMVMLHTELMPLFRVHQAFKVAGAVTEPTSALLLVVEDEGKRCALMVDDLLGQQQVVVKSLAAGLGQLRGVSGGAIMGDGRVGLILDVPSLLSLARRTSDQAEAEAGLVMSAG